MISTTPLVRSGLAVLREQGFVQLHRLSVGLFTHAAAVDEHYRNALDLLAEAPNVRLAALFGPEHGLASDAQDLIGVADSHNSGSDLRVFSLYGHTYASLSPTAEQLRGLDSLVIDLQDVGSRYYTFQATMLLCMEAASRLGLKVVVLDRPNPLGGIEVEGPALQPGYQSFVGIHPVVTRHGMTIGELARLYHAERRLTCELEVVRCEGWKRSMSFEQTGLPWVMPSPNMPTVETAWVYPGQCLLEGTNLSEGRGTTRPFELCGAPGIDAQALSRRLSADSLPGVVFRPAWFRPTFHKFAGESCGGVQLHVTDPSAFRPVRTGLHVLAALRAAAGKGFDWRREPYEFVSDRLAIDLLFGSDRERRALEDGVSAREIAAAWEAEEEELRKRRQPFLLY
jgi:uncharacterized protein YbbC (DUF1343 family)